MKTRREAARMAVLAGCLVATILPGGAGGQTIRGTVVEADRHPIPDAVVELRASDGRLLARAVSDTIGRFVLESAGDGPMHLEATHLGYADWETAPFRLEPHADVEILVRLNVAAIPLEAVTVEARSSRSLRRLADFERRRRNPAFGGYFLGEEEIDRRRASRPSNLPLAAPGMTVRPVPGPFDRWWVYSGDCPAQVYVDGVRINQLVTSVDEYLTIDRIAGVEVYPRALSAPPQYQDSRGRECGSVLYWTKELEPDGDGTWSATKIAVGSVLIAGLLGVGLVLGG
ncbi:MAG: carboxypeptidase-like regulatory domain-containing protein [Longimicrobiales bacterium]|nr:carboxypeptidase-like regulatory domain-containing protein [Longimicrobiales bacterium]